MKLKPPQARRGWEYYTENKIWNPNSDINLEGLKVVAQINAERLPSKGPLPAPSKFVDMTYVQEALKELGRR
jgi:hypothetical protein